MDTINCTAFAVGQMYVERYFPPQTKTKVESLVVELKAAFKRRIEQLSWMHTVTRQEALKKLAAYNFKIGFPDHPRGLCVGGNTSRRSGGRCAEGCGRGLEAPCRAQGGTGGLVGMDLSAPNEQFVPLS